MGPLVEQMARELSQEVKEIERVASIAQEVLEKNPELANEMKAEVEAALESGDIEGIGEIVHGEAMGEFLQQVKDAVAEEEPLSLEGQLTEPVKSSEPEGSPPDVVRSGDAARSAGGATAEEDEEPVTTAPTAEEDEEPVTKAPTATTTASFNAPKQKVGRGQKKKKRKEAQKKAKAAAARGQHHRSNHGKRHHKHEHSHKYYDD